MNNNDILRRIRYILAYNDQKMQKVFNEIGEEVSTDDIEAWLKQDNAAGFKNLNDKKMAIFLNGLIIHKRGKTDNPPPSENKLGNNLIFMKLKIAFNLKAENILEIMSMADFKMSKHELSAFFRRKDHKHYKECKDQILRNFLSGLQKKYRL